MCRFLIRSVAILMLFLAPANATAISVFQSGLPGARGFAFFPFWQQVLTDMTTAEMRANMVHPQACTAERTCIPAAWTTFLDSIRKLAPREQMDAVNKWANARPFVEDWVNWHVPDYWETPGEFLAHGGECKDYAIIKYFSLVRLGFSPADLRIVVVNDMNLKAFHAVLAVRNAGGVWLLDNQIAQVVPMDIAVQYAPIYSLNERDWWIHSVPRITVGNLTITAGPVTANP
jgi:predicted transglutaminase-like cysteine proteinase